MCDYSLEGFASRKAEVGDKLIVSRHVGHGFMRVEDAEKLDAQRIIANVCMTCLAPGTVLNVTINGATYKDVLFGQFAKDVQGYKDHMVIDGSAYLVAGMVHGTTAEVLSIPGVEPVVETSLDEKLGLDKLPEAPVSEPAQPSAFRRMVERVRERVS